MLVVIHRDEDLAWLSLRNAVAVHAIAVDQLNAYDVLVNDEVVFTSVAFDAYVAGPTAGSRQGDRREVEASAQPSSETAAAPATTPSWRGPRLRCRRGAADARLGRARALLPMPR